MIRSIIFDIDNTLYNYDHAHAIALRALENYMAEQFAWERRRLSRRSLLSTAKSRRRSGRKQLVTIG